MIWLVVADTGWRGGWTSFSGMGGEVEEPKNFRQGREASLMVSIDGSHIVSDSTLKSWRLPVKKNHWPLCSRICWPRLKSRLNYDGKTILMLSTACPTGQVRTLRTACQIQTQILTLNKPQVQSAFFLILKTLKLSSKSKQRSSFPDWKLKLVSMNMNMYFLTVSF